MTNSPRARCILQVDLSKIAANLKSIRQRVKPLQVMAVLKANAYGLGLLPVAECLAREGVERFGVADVSEALIIRDLGIPVQILGSVLPREVDAAVAHGIVLPVTDKETAQVISKAAVKQGRTAVVQLLIDTGMGRLGWQKAKTVEEISSVFDLPGLHVEGIYSHFPDAYSNPEFSQKQIDGLRTLMNELGRDFELVHIANSDGINHLPTAYQAPFNMVRTGINLYGYFDLLGKQNLDLEPVIRLSSTLVSVRRMPQGSSIGYGRDHILPRESLVGTVAIGYADGFPMGLSGGAGMPQGKVKVRGQECPVIGRVSMDYITVLLENCADAEVGDEVVCLGEGLSLDEWVSARRSITYETICALGQRVQRQYI